MVVDIFLDTPDIEAYKRHIDIICGGTTNPSLMSKMGIPPERYQSHCRDMLEVLGPSGVLSVEVTEVVPSRMYVEAKRFMQWGEKRIVVKIPSPFYMDLETARRICKGDPMKLLDGENSELNKGVKLKDASADGSNLTPVIYVDTLPLIGRLAEEGVPLNVTCGFGFEQARDVAATLTKALKKNHDNYARKNYFSIFWGRLLDSYASDKELGIKEYFNQEDLNKLLDLSAKEVVECARQLQGSDMRIIIGSARLPKIWEENAKAMDKRYQAENNSKLEPHLTRLQREAYRAMLQIAQLVNAIPTVFPGILDAARFNSATSTAVKNFADDFLKLNG